MKPVWRNLITLGAIALVISAAAALSPKTKIGGTEKIPMSEDWDVVSVADGDTITVKRNGETKKIRFCGIDAPEKSQTLGKQSTEKLRSLVQLAKNQVIIIPVETDRYGRTVAEVMAAVSGEWGEEISFQEEMLKSGMAYYYRKYAANCPNHLAFEQAEEIGKTSKAGVWSNPSLEKPWEYRKRGR